MADQPQLALSTAGLARGVRCVTEASKIAVGRIRALTGRLGLVFDQDARVLRVMYCRDFAREFEYLRWQQTGEAPDRQVSGAFELVALSSPQQYDACTVDGRPLAELVEEAGDDMWVGVAYYWLDLGFGSHEGEEPECDGNGEHATQ